MNKKRLIRGFENNTEPINGVVYLYLIRTGFHVHYVGASKNPKSRIRMHRTGKNNATIGKLMADGAELVPFKAYPESIAYAEEAKLIRWYQNYGMCECNAKKQ